MRDVAVRAGVSLTTASRALNDRGDVADETRELVRQVARQQGYRAGRRPAAGRRREGGIVAMVLPMTHAAYFSTIMAGVAEALDEHDLRLVLCPAPESAPPRVPGLSELLPAGVDGSLLVLQRRPRSELRALHASGHPTVVVDPFERADPDVPVVSAAHSSGADQAVRHLLALGHRRIAAVTGPAGGLATEERLRGYHAALGAAGVMTDARLIVEADFSIGGGRAAAARLLDLPEPPTAVFAFNDLLAVGVIQEARARGLPLPERLSVVGFDDVGQAAIVEPALTTIRQPLTEMGRMAVSLLVRLIEGESLEALHVELGTRLVVRASTAPPAGAQAAAGSTASTT